MTIVSSAAYVNSTQTIGRTQTLAQIGSSTLVSSIVAVAPLPSPGELLVYFSRHKMSGLGYVEGIITGVIPESRVAQVVTLRTKCPPVPLAA
jgi:hypothetical protein